MCLVYFGKGIGSEQNGVRPAVVVQNDIGNKYSTTTLVCPVTSKSKKKMPTHVEITPNDCSVNENSVVLCEQSRVIDKQRMLKKLGEIKNMELINEINHKIAISFGLGE